MSLRLYLFESGMAFVMLTLKAQQLLVACVSAIHGRNAVGERSIQM